VSACFSTKATGFKERNPKVAGFELKAKKNCRGEGRLPAYPGQGQQPVRQPNGEERQTISRQIEKMPTRKGFKDFFQKNVAAL